MPPRRTNTNASAILILMALLAGGLGFYFHKTYGTLEPCAMLQLETKARVLDGRLEALGNVPKMLVNSGDQLWCAKEFAKMHLAR